MGRLGRAPKRKVTTTLKELGVAGIDIALGRVVNEEKANERLSICKDCEHYNGSRCKICGCFMLTKVGLKSSKCPIHKWN